MPDAVGNAVGDDLHLGHAHAAGGDRRSAQTHAGGDERAAGLAGDGILVGSDVHAVQTGFQILAGALLVTQVDEHQMVVGTAGHQLDAAFLQSCGQSLSVLHDLAGVLLELRLEGLAEADGLGGDDVLQRAALGAGEHGRVDALGNDRVVGQDQAAAGAAQGLVGGGGHHIGIGHRALVLATGHQTGNVSHIHHQECAVAVGDLSNLLKVDGTGVSGCTGHDQLGAHLLDLLFQLGVVDHAIGIDAVGNKVVVLAGHVHGGAMGQMAALGQIHAHDGIAQIQQGEVDGQVGLCTGMGLDVGVLGTEQLAGALDGDVLHLIHIDAAAVVTLAGQALGVLVGEHTAHGSHDGGRDDVLAGNELDVLALTGQLPVHGSPQFRVYGIDQADGIHHFFVHFSYLSLDTDRLTSCSSTRLLHTGPHCFVLS